ncbi:MAG: radical SAM protein [Bacteroidia bacterium]|nr:radical SAM protein [Bacteroidia bacterium]
MPETWSMFDRFDRRISYLRISVTDRCNLRCEYCMPEEGVKLLSHAGILRYEEILQVIRTGVSMGIDKVRITGGEPLVRKGIVDFIRSVAGIEGIKDLSLTSNGVLLSDFAGTTG